MGLKRLLSFLSTDSSNQPKIALEESEVYRILSSERRRQLLVAIEKGDETVMSVDELAEIIAAREGNATIVAGMVDDYHTQYVSLVQTHLPMLDSLGIVEWNREDGVVIVGHSTPGLVGVISDVEEQVQSVDG